MAELEWSRQGERFFEAGVDRGVLYVGDDPGVAWNGLTAISESPSGGSPRPRYIDGFKYSNLSSAEEYQATLSAYFSPREFAPCDGTASLGNGLFVTQQPRKSFGLSYRTRIGNDIQGVEHGYKIHLVYNALAEPASRSQQTLTTDTSAATTSWKITTRAPLSLGIKPTAHFVIDSRMTPNGLLRTIEEILYGTSISAPRLIPVDELLALFASAGPVVRRNLAVVPGFEDPASSVGSTIIATNLISCPSPRRDSSGYTGKWGILGGTFTLATFANFIPYTPDPSSNGVVLQATADGLTRDLNILQQVSHRYVPVEGKWYAALMWAAADQALTSASYNLVYQITFNNPAATRYISSVVPAGEATFYSGAERVVVGQAQAGDTLVHPNVYLRAISPSGLVPAGKRVWTDAWMLVEGDTEAEVRAIIERLRYWDSVTKPAGYNTVDAGTINASPTHLVPDGITTISQVRVREVTRANNTASNTLALNFSTARVSGGSGVASACLVPNKLGNGSLTALGFWRGPQTDSWTPPLEPNKRYRASVWVYIPRTHLGVNQPLHAQARQLQVLKNDLTPVFVTATAPNEPGSHRLTVEFSTDDTWTSAGFRLFHGSDSAMDLLYYDDFMLEDITDGAYPVTDEYFDGDTPNGNGFIYGWEGERNRSPSYALSWYE